MNKFQHFFRKTNEKIRHFRGKVAALKKKEVEDIKPVVAPVADKKQNMEISISASTMAKFIALVILFGVLSYFFYVIREIVLIFFVSLFFAAALDPMVDALERRKIPRAAGVIVIYLVVLFGLGVLISSLVPVIAGEVAQLAGRIQDFTVNIVDGKIALPSYMEGLREPMKKFFSGVDISQISNYKDLLMKVANQLTDVAGNVFSTILVVFNGLLNTILVLVLTFLMTVDEKGIDKFITSLFSARHTVYIRNKMNVVKEKIGDWLRGQITLCFVVGIMVYIGILTVGIFGTKVEYAALISLVAGFTEIIPYAGPFLAWLVAMPIVANQSVSLIVWMTVIMYIVQLLENNIVVPLIMNKATGISPIFVMFSMMVGLELMGVMGMILAVPLATTVAIFVKDYAAREK
jgi:predicted PurR-regulated permease PerM